MDFDTAKILGGVGAILMILGPVPYVGWLLEIVGLVFILIALKSLSEHYGNEEIFRNALIALILELVGVVTGITLFIVGMTSFFDIHITIHMGEPPHSTASLFDVLTLVVATFIAAWVFILVAAIFWRRALNILAEVSGEKLFDTAGLLILIGAALTVVLIGFVILFVAYILLAVAFFTLKPSPRATQPVIVMRQPSSFAP